MKRAERAALADLAKVVAEELAATGPGEASQACLAALEQNLWLVPHLLEMMVEAGAKQEPNDEPAAGLGFLLQHGLEFIRYAIERGSAEAHDLAAAMRSRLLALGNARKLDPGVLLLVLTKFTAAKLEIGDELRGLMAEFVEAASESDIMAANPHAHDRHLKAVVRELGGNPFAIHAEWAQGIDALPPPHRAVLAGSLLDSGQPAAREAAIGALLDADSGARQAMAKRIEGAAPRGVVTGSMLRRMIMLRNWLPEADRPAVDGAIKAVRMSGVECAALAAPPIQQILGSAMDGAGAASVFALVRDGRRKTSLAGLLLKEGIGVRDAWVRHGLTRDEVQAFLDEIDGAIDVFPVPLDFVRSVVGHYVAISAEKAVMPPFGLVEFAEAIGLETVNPRLLPVEELVQSLCATLAADELAPEAVAARLRRSRSWTDDYRFCECWFEDDTRVAALLDGRRVPARERPAVIMDKLLAKLRRRWAEVFAWTAAAMQHGGANDRWAEFALVARELLGARPLAEIPVMRIIAEQTVEAWQERKASRSIR